MLLYVVSGSTGTHKNFCIRRFIMFEKALYIIGLVMALCYFFFGIDDLIWDIAGFIRRLITRKEQRLPAGMLDSAAPKLLALAVAAWHEENVLEPVVDNMLTSIHYPRSMVHIFLGVYPNDLGTLAAAERLEARYPNVHVVVNGRPGPTCKADNINSIIRAVRLFEESRGWRFASVTVHDSEDVVHPCELQVTNVLIDRHDALQFPVFPLQRMPTWRNFFKNLTSGTYADEFAEHHYRAMGLRDSMSAVVSSAGTGFVLSRRILDAYRGRELFPEGSLTEDYKLSLTLAQSGYKVHYVLEKVRRLTSGGKLKWDYIATRSIFPATFRAAVKQKTRWIYGITMQSVRLSDIFAPGKLTLAGRYSLYKDLKAKFSNLAVLPGYLVLLYNVLSLLLPGLPLMFPGATLSWWLTLVLLGLLVFRQVLRAVAIRNVYGMKSVLFSSLLPPLLPIRLVWGNIINLAATLRAWRQLLFGTGSAKSGRTPAWNKTDHEFLDNQVLFGYFRNLCDVLIEKAYADAGVMKNVLALSRRRGVSLSDILLQHNIVTEDRLADAVAASQHAPYMRSLSVFDTGLLSSHDADRLFDNFCCPVLATPEGVVWAVTIFTPARILDELGAAGGKIVYTTKEEVTLFLVRQYAGVQGADRSAVLKALRAGRLGWEQAVIALDNLADYPGILEYMGLDTAARWGTEFSLRSLLNAGRSRAAY